MGFDFDKYKGSGGNFITAAEKLVLAENGIPFTIREIRVVHKFEKENYELTIDVPDPESGDNEERVLSFPIGSGAESRDATLNGMQEYLAGGGDPVEAKVEKIGRAFFVSAA